MAAGRDVVGRPEQAAEGRLEAERRERVAGQVLSQRDLRIPAGLHDHRLARQEADHHQVRVRANRAGIVAVGRVVEVVAGVDLLVRVEEGRGDGEETIGIGHRQRSEQQRVDQPERGGGGADRQAERQDRGRRRGAMPLQLAPSEDDVSPERVEPRQATLVAQRVHRHWNVPRDQSGGAGGIGRVVSSPARLLFSQLDMQAQLELEVTVAALTAHRTEEPGDPLTEAAHVSSCAVLRGVAQHVLHDGGHAVPRLLLLGELATSRPA